MNDELQKAHDEHVAETMLSEAIDWVPCGSHSYPEPEECYYCANDILADEVNRLRAILAQEPIYQEALKTLLEIRDKFLPALKRDSREGDKVLCHVGGVAYLIAKTAPEFKYPAAKESKSC